ncbi:non-ribosomal peptide synthetase [Actinokineospora auranticolor]|uniref:Amino acid adenylation domain-containing protein n=1 Tax=Actinokineospora auranticolor TaxID=155976 RepID=A0A2S6GD43_9PSEU|nr:non-ribosomal peptide synthetase [Actinokineospora auranticolor]PPK63149.1 amino acid adenylation domain-containing protein [Actinokineospora auranticolor]
MTEIFDPALIADPGVAARVEALSPAQRALLAALLRRQDGTAAEDNRVAPRPPGLTEIPLSYAQQRLWFIDQLHPGNPAYNCPIAVRLRGELDLAALNASLRDIVTRHEAMRTRFGSRDAVPFQVVDPPGPLGLDLVDLVGLPEGEREAELVRYVLADGGAPFDLAAGPVMRTSLIRLTEREHVLLLNIHHIVTDGWSMRVFYEELAALYSAHHDGRVPDLPPLAVQYPDFALWEQNTLVGDRLARELAYWRRQLADLPALDLPTDRPHPPVAGPDGAVTYFRLDADRVAALSALGREQRATLYMTMLSAFFVLLSRYSAQRDLAVSTSVSGRPSPELESLVGFFVNTVVIRGRLDGEPTFRELLDRVRETTIGAFANQSVPFERLVEELQPVRDPGRIPLAPVIFLMDSTPDEGPRLAGLDVEPVEHDAGTAKFDLLLSIRESEGRLRARVQYRTDLFDADTIDRMIGHYLVLLDEAIADPDRPVSALPLLTAAERDQLLVAVNDTATEFPAHATLHGLVEDRAESDPDAVAAQHPGGELTYGELDAAANRLANHLVAHGVGRGSRVGLALRRTPSLLVGILGVLKAGAAYVPLDPAYPAERLTFMLDDAEIAYLVTEAEVRDGLPGTSLGVLDLTADTDVLAAASPERPAVTADPGDIAYVIYTSGSTGAPKGIELAHRGVVNNLTDLNRRHGVGPGDSVLSLSSPSFDMCVYETLGMLTSGGTTVFTDPEHAKDPAHWAGLLVEHGVTVWNSAPSLLDLLTGYLEAAPERVSLPALRVAWLGGDWVPVSLPDRVRALAPNLAFVSLGGATESSIHSIIYPVGDVDPGWTSIPYGTPMANQRAYILDDAGQPVPVGVPGELHLAGVGLARGYLNRPKLTAEKFVDRDGERLYKTGDLARWRRDGVIELLGRKDFLVKVNGLRIELGEIEAALRDHDDVGDAVVAARTDDAGDRQLVGYLVAEPGAALDVPAVRRFLENRLPGYMVPPVLMVIDEIPVSPNGKVDREALPDPRREGGTGRTTGGPPRNELEEHIVEVWRSLLGVHTIGIDEDFFDLGGDSFKAIRVAQLVRPGLPVVELFKNPTPRRLAEFIGSGRAAESASRLLHPLTPESGTPDLTLVCVPYGGGNVVSYQPLAERLPKRLALWAAALPGHDLSVADDDLVPIAESARRCADELLDRITGPIALYGQCAGSALAVKLAQELEDRGVELTAVYIGAVLPDPDPAASVARVHREGGPGEAFYQHMRGLGGFDGVLSDEDRDGILRVIWHDMAQAAGFFLDSEQAPRPPLRAPIRLVIGDDDHATVGFETRYVEWGRFGSSVQLSVIPGGGHYFVKHHARELAELLSAFHPLT